MTPIGTLYTRALRARLLVCLSATFLLGGAALADQKGVIGAQDGRETTIAALFLPLPPAMVDDSATLSVAHFDAKSAERGYSLDAVRDDGGAVPRVYLARAPKELVSLESPDVRKDFFLRMLLPIVLAENEQILADRQRLLAVAARFHELDPNSADGRWLAQLREKYGLSDAKLRDPMAELIKRVDVVPPSLALAQAALESGWGTSRGAQRSASPFGQMVFLDNDRSKVRPFEEFAHAVEAYANNLNTHKAYTRFRLKRAEQRARGATPDGYELAQTLSAYSERKSDYLRDVRGIIKANKLQKLDKARLEG